MQLQAVIFYLAIAALLGYLGRDKALRFWGHFLLSFLLSPIAGLLALGLEEWIANSQKAKQAA